jgi:hypothetical protein
LAVSILLGALFLASPWLEAFTVVPVISFPAMFIMGYCLRIRDSLKKLSLLDNGEVVITLTDSSLNVESAMGKSEMNWKLFSELWEFQTVYLLFYHGYQFITLPKAQVTPEFMEFIKTRISTIKR